VASFAFWRAGNDGTSYYRCVTPAQSLAWLRPKTHGSIWARTSRPHDIYVDARLSEQEMRRDVVIGQRVAHPDAMPHWRWMAEHKTTRLIMDLDDDYFKIDKENRTAYEFWQGEYRDNLLEGIQLSDVVTVASQGLKESLEKTTGHPNIRVVENCIDAGATGIVRPYNPEVLKIGWAGTENTAAWLPMIKDVINKAAADKYGRRVYVEFIGVPADYAGSLGFRFRKGFGRCITFIHDMRSYIQELGTIDILLAPYRSTPFTEAKFPTKALEAGALGIPLIASAIRPYRDWITHGVNGFLVPNNRQHEWGHYLGALIEDVELRKRIGKAARERAQLNSKQSFGVKWEEATLS
jgi:glycosyltransferase involved in cell wall biosynthesis